MADRYASLKQGLVGCWIPSVSGSGLLLPDLSGRNNNGSLVGMDASDWVSASYGRALDFDGSDDKVTATHPLGVGVSRCTFSVWMRKTSASDIAISSIGSETANSRFHISWFSDGQLYCTVENSASSYGEFTPSFTSNFRNYCLVYDGTQATNASRLRVFLDGQQVSLSYTGTIPSTAISSNVVAIGAGSGSFSKSQQDDIRIYNRALTESEIKLLASEPGIGFKRISSSAFATRYAYKPAKPRNYSVIRNRDPNYSTLRQGLVAAYCPSISGQGNVLPDLVGGNHGTLTNMDASDWVASGDGRALDFDGSNDNVRVAFARPAFPFTLSCWALTTTDTTNEYSLVLCRSTADDGQFSILWGGAIAGDYIYARQEPDTGGALVAARSQNAFTTNKWTHVVAVFRSNTYRQIYVDGVAGVEDTTNVATPSVDRLAIGRLDRLNPSGAFAGQIDDCRVYSRELTEPEIKLLASKRGIGLEPRKPKITFADLGVQKTYSVVRVKETDYATLRQGLVGAWCPSLPNGGSGNTLPDVSGYNNHGTLTNMGPEDWVSGQYGRALEFDGTDTSGANDTQNRVTLSKDFGVDVIGFSAWISPIALNKRGICASWPVNTAPRFAVTLLTNGTLEVYRGQNTQSTAALSTNRWQHIFVFSDGNNTSYYIDGVFSNTANQQGITPGLQTNFLLGNNYWGALEGYLDDVRIYDRHLTLAEIRLLASRPGIGLRQESHRQTFYQFPSFQPALAKRSSAIIGGGIT